MTNINSGVKVMQRDSGAGLASVRMMRRVNVNSTFVFVEGDSDIAFYRFIIDPVHATLEVMKGKDAAMEAVGKANMRKEKGVLAFVDSDFDRILNIGPDDNVIRTDTHDIETLMLRTELFQYAEVGFADEKKIRSFQYTYKEIHNEIHRIGCCIGKLRLISKEKGLFLNFKEAEKRLEDGTVIFLSDGRVKFDERQYVYECVNSTSNCKMEFRKIFEIYQNDCREFDKWQLCRGHDLCLLLAIFYSKDMFGKRNIYRSEIENTIRSTYLGSGKFIETEMFSEIKSWQMKNCGWKVLSDKLV